MNKLSILIVEDNIELGQLFAEILESDTIAVELIRDGQKALEYLSKTRPDIVVLDMQLPQITGDLILKHMRETANLKDIRVVVVTANAMMAAVVENQADIVLIKPVSYAQLNTLVSRLLASNNH
jgi:two-component system cell cycle response regulator DivK